MFNINFGRKNQLSGAGVSIDDRSIKLVVGLGNPGKEHNGTYHSVGSMFVDSLAEALAEKGSPKWRTLKFSSYLKSGGVILAKPTTFMNQSGKAIVELSNFFKIEPDETLIVHDDSDIPLGKYKISFARGHAGHNGVKSILESVKTDGLLRLRIGIRSRLGKAGSFVLKKINEEDLETLDRLFLEIETRHFEV